MIGDPLTVALASSVAWVAGAIGAHALVFHLVRVRRRARTLAGLFGAAVLGHLGVALSAGTDGWRAVYGVVLIGCAFICYMPFYYTVSASQSVQMLIALERRPGGLDPDELRRLYPVDDVLAGRLETLVGAGYLRAVEGRLALTRKGRMIARAFASVKRVWRLGPGG